MDRERGLFQMDQKWVGEMRDGRDWTMTGYDEDGNIIGKYVNGVKQ